MREDRSAALRVIGGRLRGRRLAYHGDPGTRPMKDRVREAMFNLLGGSATRPSYVIDLFAGTGAIAFEALSRGAVRAWVFEYNFQAGKVLEANAQALGLSEQIECTLGDAFIWVPRTSIPTDLPWLVVCSPPYAFYHERLVEVEGLLAGLWERSPLASTFVIESDVPFDASFLAGEGWESREYPPARLTWGSRGQGETSRVQREG